MTEQIELEITSVPSYKDGDTFIETLLGLSIRSSNLLNSLLKIVSMGDQFEQTDRFKQGLNIRREVLGDAYVEKALQGIDNPLQKSHQQYITEEWSKWGRPGLTRKQRSLLNIGILMTLNRSTELGVHIRGALRNGLTEEEITEAITHTMMYSGVPAGVEASKVAARVIKEMKENGELDSAAKKAGQGGEEAVLAS